MKHYLKLIITNETKTLVLLTKSTTSSSTLVNTIMENKITSIWNKIKSKRVNYTIKKHTIDRFKIVTDKNMRKMSNIVENLIGDMWRVGFKYI